MRLSGIARRRKLLLMLDEFPALGRLDFFESALAFMAGYGLRAFLIAQSLNQIDKAYGPNHAILDNCHVRVTFATNDERTARRISDALGTATELRAQRNYAGHRLAPWLGHLMVSRQETARPLLTPGEVMQLPPSDEVVMVSGHPPIRASKLRYFEDRNFLPRVMQPPVLADGGYRDRPVARPDDWSGLTPLAESSVAIPAHARGNASDGGGVGLEPKYVRDQEVELVSPPANDLAVLVDDDCDGEEMPANALPQPMDSRLTRRARWAALDPDDGMAL